MSIEGPREWKDEEVRKRLLEHFWNMVDYWDRLPSHKTTRDRLDGLMHSILVALDGGSELPAFALVPMPHESDEKFHRDNEENWYRTPKDADRESIKKFDVGGALHEEMYLHDPRRIWTPE